MQEGWNAKGLLRPLWNRYRDKGARDALAAAVGSTGSTLSAINQGNRNLGWDLAGRLVNELEKAGVHVTLLDLGAPAAEQAAVRSAAMGDRLAAVEAEIAQLQRELNELRPRQGDAS